jgi:AcrR family transcriptional regulator
VGVRDVAAAAGVSVGTVTYHFGSVQEILSEAMVLHIERYYAALSEAAEQATGGAEALRLLVDALFTEDTDRHWRMWFDYWNAGEQDTDAAFAGGQAQRYETWHQPDPRPGRTGRRRRGVRRRRPGRLHRSASPPSPTASPCNGCARPSRRARYRVIEDAASMGLLHTHRALLPPLGDRAASSYSPDPMIVAIRVRSLVRGSVQ